ncbi:LysR family transcriptional regulator [Nocardia rhamnosiphila]
MERYEIQTLLILAEELHFARTAERLHVSPGRVSQTIKKIERRIGAPLFERSSRQVTLTPLGQRFYGELLPAYEQIQQAIRNATEAGRGLGGTVRVAFSAPWCGRLVVRAAERFRAENPRCEIQIREMSLTDSHGPLKAGDADLQLSEHPIDDPHLTTGPVLFSEPAALLVPARHPLAHLETATFNDLADTPLLTFAGVPRAFSDLHYPHHTPDGAPIPHRPVTIHFPEALCFIGEGNGVTIVAARASEYHTRPDVAYIPLLDAPPLDYGLLWNTARATAAVQQFARTIHRTAQLSSE